MPEVFVYVREVRPDEIDPLGHANNVAYIQWMQEAALAHSAAQGWPGERYRAVGAGWVVRSHHIEYLRPAGSGQKVVIRTWVATLHRATSLRQFEFFAEDENTRLAVAETLWAFIDYRTGMPRRIPPEMIEAFPVVGRRQLLDGSREKSDGPREKADWLQSGTTPGKAAEESRRTDISSSITLP